MAHLRYEKSQSLCFTQNSSPVGFIANYHTSKTCIGEKDIGTITNDNRSDIMVVKISPQPGKLFDGMRHRKQISRPANLPGAMSTQEFIGEYVSNILLGKYFNKCAFVQLIVSVRIVRQIFPITLSL